MQEGECLECLAPSLPSSCFFFKLAVSKFFCKVVDWTRLAAGCFIQSDECSTPATAAAFADDSANVNTNCVQLTVTQDATSCVITRQFPSISWNPKFHCRIHKSSTIFPILSHTNPIHITPSYLYKIHLNVIHPPTSWYS
jgi:hypothetical protein